MELPIWMRRTLYATTVANVGAAIAFLPPASAIRGLLGFPEGHPLYLTTVSLFVLLFGLAYLGAAVTGRADRLFVMLSAAGKLSFVAIVTAFWLAGSVPLRAVVVASGDLVFGLLFVRCLLEAAPAGAATPRALRVHG